jgi:hypothetical protein
MEISAINNNTMTALQSILQSMRGKTYEEVLDAAVYLYCNVEHEKIYPKEIVDGFYNALMIINCLTAVQFLELRDTILRKSVLV